LINRQNKISGQQNRPKNKSHLRKLRRYADLLPSIEADFSKYPPAEEAARLADEISWFSSVVKTFPPDAGYPYRRRLRALKIFLSLHPELQLAV
jgi:hypothetical protein